MTPTLDALRVQLQEAASALHATARLLVLAGDALPAAEVTELQRQARQLIDAGEQLATRVESVLARGK